MRTYRLEYDSDRFGVEKAIEFEALDAAKALQFAKREAQGRWARLYEDGRSICRLVRVDPHGDNIWVIAADVPASQQSRAGTI